MIENSRKHGCNMKQLLQNMKDGQAEVVEMPVPGVQAGFALVRTAASLVSAGTERMVVEFAEKGLIGKARSRPDLVKQVIDKAKREGVVSTLEAALNRLEQPMALGYSSAGTIVELGEGMHGFSVGQRVACAGGGYAVHAEYVLVPKNLLTPLPETVDFESAAFTTLGAIAMQGFRLAEVTLGDRVAVVGLGLLGLLTAQLAKAAGCEVFGADLDESRIALARTYHIHAVNRDDAESEAMSFTAENGFDAVLICADTTSNDPVWLAGQIARERGVIVAVGAVGMNIPRKLYYEKELSFIVSRSYGPGRYDPAYEEEGQDYPIAYVRWTEGRNLASFVQLLASGQVSIKPMITHRFSIEEAVKAYSLITGKEQEPFLGVVLTYPQDEEDVAVTRQVDVQPSLKLKTQGRLAVGVLGAGNYARGVFLPIIKKSKLAELHTVVSGAGMTATSAARQFGFKYASSSEEDVIDNDAINAAVILTRHHLHAQQVNQCLGQGKHVYCEKPLAIDEEGLRLVVEAMKSNPDWLLMVGFNRRFAPMSQALKAFLSEGQPLYAHYRVNAGWLLDNHWLHDPGQGGGRIIGEGCHFIDYLCFLTGSVPETVQVASLPSSNHQADTLSMQFSFADGSVGVVDYLSNGPKTYPKEMVEVFQQGKAARLDDFRTLTLANEKHITRKHARLRQDKGHRQAWQAFVNGIHAGEPPIPYMHLVGVTAASLAAVEALNSGEAAAIADFWAIE
jgi:predicted dehydrogenase/threonine dehydrogenase-like Zn-dependent dehydrogenase